MTEWSAPGPGPWQQDQAHNPSSSSAVMLTTFATGFNRGFEETFARYGVLLDTLAMAAVNGFMYHQPRPFDLPGPGGPRTQDEIFAELMRRNAIAEAAFRTKQWRGDLAEWDATYKPAAIATHRRLGDLDLAALDDTALVQHLREAGEHLSNMAYQHHRFNVAALLPVGDFAIQVAGWTQRDPRSLLAVLDGYSPISAVASDELRPVLDAVRADEALRRLLDGDEEPAARVAELRRRCPAFDTYMSVAGHRVVEGFDVSFPTVAERPELVIGRLTAALDADEPGARARADEFATSLRDQVPPERRDEFDELLAEARAVYRLRDERGIYSDVTAVGLLRRAMLEAGRRLAVTGAVDEPAQALEATIDELSTLLDGGRAPTADELEQRAETRKRLSAEGAPRYLGPPPPPPPPLDQLPPALARLMAAVGFTIEGVLGELDHPSGDDTTIVGIAGSPGDYEGRARLVQTIDDLWELESGDILVTPSTGEAFNCMLHLIKAIVTDHGSYASHAGIVAREMGIPAVVGTVNGSTRIRDGATIRVDGSAGEVTILD
jgi:phosphohistidine swiveling domain-containing protein